MPYVAFGEENIFYGNSEFQRLPTVIGPNQDYRFEIKVHYTQGLYAIKELNPIIDVYPASFSPYITITTKSMPTDGMLVRGSVARIHGTITTNSSIPEGRVSLVAYFVAKNIWDSPVRSAWNTSSDPINVESKVLGKDLCDDLSKFQSSPIELEYEIDGGKVVAICHNKDTNSIITKIDTESDGQLTITIPKNIIYSLSSTDCSENSDLMILMDNEEVLPIKSIHNKKDNIITVGFSKGANTIEFVGFSIMPDPSPNQYCGIVMNFDSLYLPPKFQTDLGMKAEQIRCNEGLTLALKASNKSPSCVRPQTLEELEKRGWANCIKNLTVIKANPCEQYPNDLPSPIFSNQVIIPKGSSSPEQKINLIPQTVTVSEGDTVIWNNYDNVPSTLVSDDDGWTTGLILPGESVSISFNHTGVFNYHGSPHPWKSGTIIVKEKSK